MKKKWHKSLRWIYGVIVSQSAWRTEQSKLGYAICFLTKISSHR